LHGLQIGSPSTESIKNPSSPKSRPHSCCQLHLGYRDKYLADETARGMPCFAHCIQNLIGDGFATLAAFGSIFIFVAPFAPRVFISHNKRSRRPKWLFGSAEGERWVIHHHSRHRRNDLLLATIMATGATWMVFIAKR